MNTAAIAPTKVEAIGVAITVLLPGQAVPERTTFDTVYGLHVALALATAAICVFVNTRPGVTAPSPAAAG
jgi:hypothetical protein